ncbi:MAG TPA: acetyltransferase [Mycobacteriales bacterium]|nr:acetyltransferase [Mycobacteriales bacterium]
MPPGGAPGGRARPLLLVGAGGLARETLAAVRSYDRPPWAPLGFLDDNPERHGQTLDGLPVLGPVEAVHEHPDVAVVLCTASAKDQASRQRIQDRLGLPAERYATVLHVGASLARGTEVGPGSIMLAGVVVTAPQRIGAHVVAMPHVVLTHDDEVGDYVTLAGRVSLSGGVRVGDGAYLGTGALVRESLRVGAWSLVGMGAVVLSDVPPFEVWVGNPARRLRRVEVRLA